MNRRVILYVEYHFRIGIISLDLQGRQQKCRMLFHYNVSFKPMLYVFSVLVTQSVHTHISQIHVHSDTIILYL